jgi:hypothetical protein
MLIGLPFLAGLLLADATSLADDIAPEQRLAVAWNDSASDAGLVRAMRTRAPWNFVTPALSLGRDITLRAALGTRSAKGAASSR